MSGDEREPRPGDVVADEDELGDLGGERGAQPPTPTEGTVGGSNPGLSGGSDHERMEDSDE